MKMLISFLCLITILISNGQTSDQQVVDRVMTEFLDIENPHEGLNLMKSIEENVMNLNDSIISAYYINIAICYGQLGISDSSFYYLDLGEELGKSINNDLSLIKVNNTRGLVYMGMGQFEESLSAYQKGLEIAEKTDGPKILESRRKIYGNMGGIYYQMKDFEKAAEVTLKALQLSELQEDLSSIAYNNLRLALIYGDLENIDQCIIHLETARDGLNALGDTATLIYAENTWGKILENQNQPGQALAHFNRALELSREVDNSAELVYMLNSTANINFKLGNLRLADQLARESIKVSDTYNFPHPKQGALDILYRMALSQEQYRSALDYRNQYVEITDSISGVEVRERVAELETKYETAQKEAEIARLSFENELNIVNLARARNAQLAIGVGSGLGIVLLIVFFTLRHKKQKAEKEAQELQIEALKKRFMEMHASPSELSAELDFEELNSKLNTPLTEREFETLKLSIEGKTNTEISDKLFISVSTVKFHLRNTYSKMGVGNRKEAFQYMLKTS